MSNVEDSQASGSAQGLKRNLDLQDDEAEAESTASADPGDDLTDDASYQRSVADHEMGELD